MDSKNVKKSEKISLDKNLGIAREQTALLERYEGKIQALLQERIDNQITDDMWEEKQEDLRKEFLIQYEEVCKKIDTTVPERVFRDCVYNSLHQQVRRFFGYYNAVTDVQRKVDQYNMELNDQVLSVDHKDQLAIIRKVDNVRFASDLLDALQVSAKHKDRILSHMIDRAFGVPPK
jgi:hypothetical protein